MSTEKKEDLIEQYEDAAFALMMSNYAEQEGNRLLQEFEEAKARGDVPAIPEELDKKCRQLIHKAYQKARTKERIKQSLRVIGKSAAALFVTIGLCTTLIVSVEALRTPVVNFIIEQHDKFTTINFGKDPTSQAPPPTTDDSSTTFGETPLDGLLPDGYCISHFRILEDGTFAALYYNYDGDDIFLSTTLGNGTINIDTEQAMTTPIVVGNHLGYLFAEGNKLSVIWYDDEIDTSYQLSSSNLRYADFWRILDQYAQKAEEIK